MPTAVKAKLNYRPTETTRDRLLPWAQLSVALVVTLGFFLSILIPVVASAFGYLPEAEGTNLLEVIAAVTAGPVGAVVGYFFSSTRES